MKVPGTPTSLPLKSAGCIEGSGDCTTTPLSSEMPVTLRSVAVPDQHLAILNGILSERLYLAKRFMTS